MKRGLLTKVLVGFLVGLLIVLAGSNTNKATTNQGSLAEKNIPEKSDKTLQDPIEYVLGKLKDHDLVMIGERHWAREEPVFIQNLIKRCYEKDAIDVVFLEFGNFADQDKIDAFLEAAEYDPKPIIEVLRNVTELGWGYQEYFDIFKLIYDENHKRPPSERIRLILPSWLHNEGFYNLRSHFFEYFKSSPAPEEIKGSMANYMFNSTFDRDRWMSNFVEMYRNKKNLVKGIFYAGGYHIRKDMQKKGNGWPYFSAGGTLARKYPGRVFCLTFHMRPKFWQNESDFQYLEGLFKSHGKPFAIDTKDSKISHLKLKSKIHPEGVALHEAFDGYIMLNQDAGYQRCAFVPGFYDDEFAKVVWERLRKRKILDRFPPKFKEWREKTPTGEELMKLIEQGLH